jgi:hypothetical protein
MDESIAHLPIRGASKVPTPAEQLERGSNHSFQGLFRVVTMMQMEFYFTVIATNQIIQVVKESIVIFLGGEKESVLGCHAIRITKLLYQFGILGVPALNAPQADLKFRLAVGTRPKRFVVVTKSKHDMANSFATMLFSTNALFK